MQTSNRTGKRCRLGCGNKSISR